MSDKPTADPSTPDPVPVPAQAQKASPFRYFQRRPYAERAQSGRVLPPAPAWMMKPLKPPGYRPPPDKP